MVLEQSGIVPQLLDVNKREHLCIGQVPYLYCGMKIIFKVESRANTWVMTIPGPSHEINLKEMLSYKPYFTKQEAEAQEWK